MKIQNDSLALAPNIGVGATETFCTVPGVNAVVSMFFHMSCTGQELFCAPMSSNKF